MHKNPNISLGKFTLVFLRRGFWGVYENIIFYFYIFCLPYRIRHFEFFKFPKFYSKFLISDPIILPCMGVVNIIGNNFLSFLCNLKFKIS